MKLIVLIMLTIFSSEGVASELKFDSKRTVKVNTYITEQINEVANRIYKLSNNNNDPIYIYINSPGGNLSAANNVLTAIASAQDKGVEVVCGVETMAMSAAFFILNECTTRFALHNAQLMFHSPHFQYDGIIGYKEAREISSTIKQWALAYIKRIAQKTKMSEFVVAKMYEEEAVVTVEKYQELSPGYISIVDTFEGVKDRYFVPNTGKKELDDNEW